MTYLTQKINIKYCNPQVVSFLGIFFLVVFFYTPNVLASGITSDVVVKLVNDARSSAQEKPLIENKKLDDIAKAKADDMIANNYFAHTSPQGKSPWYWFDSYGYDYKFAGENLAINFTDAESEQEAWMKSPTHRANILNSKYREIGVVVKEGVINGHKSTVTVQVFGTSVGDVVNLDANNKQESVAGVQNIKQNEIVSDMKFDKNLVAPGNVKFSLWQNRYSSEIGWGIIAVVTFSVMFADVAIVIHRRHIKPILIEQALHSRKV
jgi:hypothetical protein